LDAEHVLLILKRNESNSRESNQSTNHLFGDNMVNICAHKY